MCSLSYLFLILASLGQSLSSIQESHAPKGLFSELFFAVEPKDTLASRDVPALLECLAEGSSKPIIEWKKDGNPILFLGDTRRSILTNGSLYIASVYHTRMERPDEGVYQCLATIPQVGTIVSRSAKLQVVAPPKFEEEPKDLNVVKGQTASLSCVVHAIPPASVSWLKEDVPISLEDFRVKVFQSGTLEILYVDEDDQGIYKCNASNSEKFVLSSGAMLSVYKKTDIQSPFFVTTPRNIVSVIGSNVTLECAANGNPLPTVSWLKDGTTIDTHAANICETRQLGRSWKVCEKITTLQQIDSNSFEAVESLMQASDYYRKVNSPEATLCQLKAEERPTTDVKLPSWMQHGINAGSEASRNAKPGTAINMQAGLDDLGNY